MYGRVTRKYTTLFVALEHVALLGEARRLTLIQQLITGQIDTRTASTETEPEDCGSFTAPQTWREMTRALLDVLMPAKIISTSVREILLKGAETVSAYIRDEIPYSLVEISSCRRPSRRQMCTVEERVDCCFVATGLGTKTCAV